jgi:large exoprotein involved in heme utilization and adhesion
MTLTDATISASSHGPGDAGSISINGGSQFLSTRSAVTTEATEASGGNISLKAASMVRLIDSEISTSVKGGPTTAGGDINIDPDFVILQNSNIIAQAVEGQGGNINITAGTFLQDPNSSVDASSQLGVSGTVNIRSPINNLSGVIAPLSEKAVDAAALIRASCAARFQGGNRSSLVQRGRDTLPADPGSGLITSPLLAGGALVSRVLAELDTEPAKLLVTRESPSTLESRPVVHMEGFTILEEAAACRS